MWKSFEATFEPSRQIKLQEPHLSHTGAIVTIDTPKIPDTALLSEAALGEDWNQSEEDQAWAHLQQGR